MFHVQRTEAIKLKTMAFDGSEGGSVSLADAGGWTETYREENSGETKGHFFGKDILNDILDQTGCMGIRIYYAIKDEKKELVLVGADEDEDDQLRLGDKIADLSVACPPSCGNNNDLNS